MTIESTKETFHLDAFVLAVNKLKIRHYPTKEERKAESDSQRLDKQAVTPISARIELLMMFSTSYDNTSH